MTISRDLAQKCLIGKVGGEANRKGAKAAKGRRGKEGGLTIDDFRLSIFELQGEAKRNAEMRRAQGWAQMGG
jgi:hypothetical protein